MNEVLYNLYGAAGDKVYFETAAWFNHWSWSAPLATLGTAIQHALDSEAHWAPPSYCTGDRKDRRECHQPLANQSCLTILALAPVRTDPGACKERVRGKTPISPRRWWLAWLRRALVRLSWAPSPWWWILSWLTRPWCCRLRRWPHVAGVCGPR